MNKTAAGFFYGYIEGDCRQINVRQEPDGWVAYVGGNRIGAYVHKAIAEDAAVQWIRANPELDLEG